MRSWARQSKDGPQARRLLALASIYEGATRTQAARLGGVTLQIVRDWVMKFNAQGPEGLIDRKPPGQPSRLNDAHRAGLATIIESGPIPAVRRPSATARSFRVHVAPSPTGSRWRSSRRTAAPSPGNSCLPRKPQQPPACSNPPTKDPSRAAAESAHFKNQISKALGIPADSARAEAACLMAFRADEARREPLERGRCPLSATRVGSGIR